jgi:hypothetical protein
LLNIHTNKIASLKKTRQKSFVKALVLWAVYPKKPWAFSPCHAKITIFLVETFSKLQKKGEIVRKMISAEIAIYCNNLIIILLIQFGYDLLIYNAMEC